MSSTPQRYRVTTQLHYTIVGLYGNDPFQVMDLIMKLKFSLLILLFFILKNIGYGQNFEFSIDTEPKIPEKAKIFIVLKLKNISKSELLIPLFTHSYPALKFDLTDLQSGKIHRNFLSGLIDDYYLLPGYIGNSIKPGEIEMDIFSLPSKLKAGKYLLGSKLLHRT